MVDLSKTGLTAQTVPTALNRMGVMVQLESPASEARIIRVTPD